jgi:hypothetical protein
MRKFIVAAAVLAAVVTPVLAQTTPPGPPAPTVAGPQATIPAAPPPSTAAVPQTVPGAVLTPNPANSTASAPATPKSPPGAPVAGANSFTESQAKARIEARGFTNVTALKKDDKSIWRGQATKDGKSVSIALDYQGNVVAD